MIKNRKLRTVIRHEFLTIVRQPSFWISLIAVPLIIGVVLLIGMLTDSEEMNVDTAKNKLELAVIDKSGLIDPEAARSYKLDLESAAREERLTKSVIDGKIDGLIIYPSDLEETGKYRVVADNTQEDNAAIIGEIGKITLQQSLLKPIESPKLSALALSGGQSEIKSYVKGEPERQISEYIVPGAFLVLFYIVLVFSVGYALTSVSEEKENRSIEMVLSYVNPQTLIRGKLFAIVLVTLTQILFIAAMAGIAYLIARSLGNDLSLPFKVSDLTFVPSEILIGLGFLVVGFVFYVGLMAMVGAIFPSSKEASGFSSVFFILPAVPFWGLKAITDDASSMFTQALTYFPLTSPTTVMIRNTWGNLEPWQGAVSLAILATATMFVIFLAAKAFKLGTLEYSNRIKFSRLFKS